MIDYKSENENLSPRTHHNQTANSDSAAGWTDTAATSCKKKSDAEHKQGVFVGAGRDQEQSPCRESQGTGHLVLAGSINWERFGFRWKQRKKRDEL